MSWLPSRSVVLIVALASASGLRAQSIRSISPDLIRPLTPVTVRVAGTQLAEGQRIAFRLRSDPSFAPLLNITRLEDCTARECRTIVGTTPRFNVQGVFDVLLLDDRNRVLDTLASAFEVRDPPRVTVVSPSQVPRAGGVEVTVFGELFRPATVIFFGPYELREAALSADGTRITGVAPPLEAADERELFDVRAVDTRGEGAPLVNGILYRDPEPTEVTIDSVSPLLLPTTGGLLVVRTTGGQDADTLRLGSRTLSYTFSRGTYAATVPPLPAGFYPVFLVRDGRRLDTYEEPVEVAAPARVAFVDPVEVCAAGGTVLRLHGEGLREGMTISVGGVLVDALVVDDLGASICVETPSVPTGRLDVVLQDGRGRLVLDDAVTSIGGCSTTPGPQQIEASLASDGTPRAVRTARFSWHNPRPYRSIRVETIGGALIEELPGDATSVELEASGADSVEVCLRAVDQNGLLSAAVFASALAGACDRPPPLNFVGKPGTLDMPLRGAHLPASVDRCAPDTAPVPQRSVGPKGYQLSVGTAVGFVTPARFLVDASDFERDVLTTGFTLEEDADALEIYGFYQKIATDAGVELRARLTKVYPEEGRFTDEVTFPDILLDRPKEWNCATYFRANRDASDPLAQRCPDPNAPGENLKITAGEYLLDFYVVGGDRRTTYFVFADDAYDFELLIPGAPCGPYPATKVVDLTGLRTLPVVTEVLSKPLEETPQGIWTRLQAIGNWLDSNGEVHTLGAEPDSPYFEYVWTIYDRGGENGRTESSGTSSRHETLFQDYGCYYIDLEVRDRFCPVVKKRSYQIALLPCPLAECVQDGRPYQFLYPAPSPEGIYAIAGLNPDPGSGQFEGERPLELRVVVAPTCACGVEPCNPLTFGACGAAQLDDVQFRLAAWSPLQGAYVAVATQNDLIEVTDECLDVEYGPKYFHIFVDDLGRIPSIPYAPGTDRHAFRAVRLQARGVQEPPGVWHHVGAPLRMGNYPRVLDHGFWSGHFEETGPSPADRTYRFVVKSSPATEQSFDIEDSRSIDLLGVAEVDSYPNELRSGFTSRFRMSKGIYEPDEGAGSASGTVMGNGMDGAPVRIEPTVSALAGIGGGTTNVRYEWCETQEIFKNEFSEELFDSILYSGTIGPVPVTIWATIGFGLDVDIRSHTAVLVAPFEALDGGSYAETHFYLLSDLGIRIPCEVRADIIGGIGSVSVRLIPEANFRLDTHISSFDTSPDADVYYRCLFDLTMEFEGCINLLLTEACATVEIPVIEDAYLLGPEGQDPRPPVSCGQGAGAETPAPDEVDGGAAGIEQSFYTETSAPVSVWSPDGQTSIDIWLDEAGFGNFSVDNGDPTDFPFFPGFDWRGQYRDPAAAFLTDSSALVAWTETFPQDLGVTETAYRQAATTTVAEQNLYTAQDEIVVSTLQPSEDGNGWEFGPPMRIADPPGETPVGERYPDGRVALASDFADEAAWAAWVRYDDDFLVLDGSKLIYQPCTPGTPDCHCPTIPGLRAQQPCFRAVQVPNYRPQLEATGIWVRKLSADGPLSAKEKVSPPGINIEPTIAVSPSGEAAYCVWVHDPTHTDLLSQNTGRNLMFSRYDKSTDTWTAAAPVIASPDSYPGLLQPSMALSGDEDGILAFTALEEGAPTLDSGLGAGSRLVFIARLVDGVFQEPELIHGKCQKRVYGHWATISFEIPSEIDFSDLHHGFHPEWVMSFHGVGPAGLRSGSGEVMVTVLGEGMDEWTDPVSLSPPDRVVSNIGSGLGGGTVRSIFLDKGSAIPAPGGGAGVEQPRFVRSTTPLEPDLAIAHCRLRDSAPAPGGRTTATIVVENQGLAGSAITTATGRSACGLQLVYVDSEGEERVVAQRSLRPLQPGESVRFDIDIEMPHDPVELIVELEPNPVDRDPSDNRARCWFGAPPVEGLRCDTTRTSDEEPVEMVRLEWRSPVLYDEILVYRDGAMVASVDGRRTTWIDAYGSRLRATRYAVRGVVGRSRSIARECEVDSDPPPAAGFRRGDANLDGNADISDAVFVLAWLFTGGTPPRCIDAADSNDSGFVDISDPSYLLNFLFLGGRPPPEPFTACGEDPTRDQLDCAASAVCEGGGR